MAESVEKIEPR